MADCKKSDRLSCDSAYALALHEYLSRPQVKANAAQNLLEGLMRAFVSAFEPIYFEILTSRPLRIFSVCCTWF